MKYGLDRKVALIGGASKGLGRGCAIQLARAGVDVAICARNPQALHATAEFIKSETNSNVLPIEYDLSNVSGIKENVVDKVISKYRRIDILVVNSGGPKPGAFFDLTEDDWRKAFDSVLFYVIELYKWVIPHLKHQKWGRIINTTSLSVKEPAESLLLSNVFRSGVVSLAKSISKELIKDNITINNVCPGAFKTDRALELMSDNARKTGVSVEEIEEKSVAGLPLGRFQTPEEYGDLVVFLASELARGITGTTIQIDGGISNSLL